MRIFLSYTRNKDQFNKVSSFRSHLEAELGIRSPGSRVFQDTHHLAPGHHFPDALTVELDSADVLLALVSPAWLQSDWCRREFSIFTRDAAANDRVCRILPVLWVATPEMTSSSPDLVARTMANINYADWCELRYQDWEHPENQRQFGMLAEAAIALCATRQPAPYAVQQSGGVDPLRDTSAALLGSFNLSEQAKLVLKQVADSGAQFVLEHKLSTGRPTEFIFIGGAVGQVKYEDPRFIDEDLELLVALQLLRMEYTSKGNRKFSITRAGTSLARGMTNL